MTLRSWDDVTDGARILGLHRAERVIDARIVFAGSRIETDPGGDDSAHAVTGVSHSLVQAPSCRARNVRGRIS